MRPFNVSLVVLVACLLTPEAAAQAAAPLTQRFSMTSGSPMIPMATPGAGAVVGVAGVATAANAGAAERPPVASTASRRIPDADAKDGSAKPSTTSLPSLPSMGIVSAPDWTTFVVVAAFIAALMH